MTVESRLLPRSSREKDLVKYASKQGAKQEQERVIKIIQSNQSINSDQEFFLVRAIEGEQK